MEQSFIEEMKNELIAQRNTIIESLAEQSDEMKDLIKTVESGDEADVASDAIDRTLLTALGAQSAKKLQGINNALDRIHQGKYGYCLRCGKEIPKERLRIIPFAPMCIQCTNAEEKRNR